ncbi:MAG TPA: DNA polymerase IV [Gemmatimonadaceae bacterium]|nr:DNA polymerase IV [Gemmatimonadaceae bacterium]
MSATARRILLADADAFYVAVARLIDPEGAGKSPLLIVGGSRESRGVVCSASYETRKFGVRSAMPTAQALKLCPQAMCVPVPRGACSRKSAEIRRVLQRFTPVVEGASIDEWYLDLGGTEQLYDHESLERTAHRIREAVREETSLSVSMGGGTNKLVAKMAVEVAKPKPDNNATGVHVVAPGEEATFLKRFLLAEIPLVGPKFVTRLERAGLRTVNDVLEHPLPELIRWFGDREGQWLYERVRGIDSGAVEGHGEQKSMSREETFSTDISDDATLERELFALCARVASDLRAELLAARTIRVKIKDADFTIRQAGRTLPEAVVSDRVIYGVARELLHTLRSRRRTAARLIGIALSSLATSPEPPQLALFPDATASLETERDRKVAHTVDAVRAKFGQDAIGAAQLSKHEDES